MNVLTLKIPESLDAALQAASRRRGLSKSAVVREAIEQSLGLHDEQGAVAAQWVSQWRGLLTNPPVASATLGKNTQQDERLAHLLAKHVR